MSPPSSASPAPASAGPSTPQRKASGDEKPEVPWAFIDCPTDTLIILISHMLELLIQHNDQVVLTPDALTRFHSRAAPGISVIEYLRRIVKYTNMEKIPLLSLLAYIDITCQHLPTFTLSSLTVHRFLIAGVCAGSKAQCDVFCTNGHYAKVGGIKVQELNSLERELLRVTQWALCCNADLLQRYYTSLIKSHGGYIQAPAPSTIPFRPFPRSSSKPRKSESPARTRGVSTPRTDLIEEDPAEAGPSTTLPTVTDDEEVPKEREDEAMEDEPPQTEFAVPTTNAAIIAPPEEMAGDVNANTGEVGKEEEMDVDPPDQPAQPPDSSAPQYSPHSDGSSSIPSSSNSPRSSRSRHSRLTSLQNKQLRDGQPASPRLEKRTATGSATGTPNLSSAMSNGLRVDEGNPYEKPLGGEEEMLVAPPPPLQSPASSPHPLSPPSAETAIAASAAQQSQHHHHHLHAPSGKALKSFVGGIFHRKTTPTHDHPPPSASASSTAHPPSRSSREPEPTLQHIDLHNGLEESVPPRPTHPDGKGEPWQPSSLITSSSNVAPETTSPRRTAPLPRSPRVGPGRPSASPRLGGVGGGSGMRPEIASPVTPKVRSRESVEALRSAPPPLGAGAVGAVGGDEGKRRVV